MRKLKKLAPLLGVLALSLLAWGLGLHHHLTFDALKAHQNAWDHFIAEHYGLSLLLYGALYTGVVALSLPAATFMTLAGGFFFGPAVGTGAVVVSATLGATLLFLSARLASSEVLDQKAKGITKKMQEGFQENALSYLLTLRLIPLFPFVAVNLGAAFFQIPLKTFLLGTFFGIIPGSFVYVSMGGALREALQKPDFSPSLVLEPKILMALVGLGILSLLPVLYKRFKKKGL